MKRRDIAGILLTKRQLHVPGRLHAKSSDIADIITGKLPVKRRDIAGTSTGK